LGNKQNIAQMYNMKLTKYNSVQFDSIHLLRCLTTAEELIIIIIIIINTNNNEKGNKKP
jgi:hypothetical protein